MSTSTLDLLRRAYIAGVIVELAQNDTIRLSGHPAPVELITELKASKADVLAVLSGQGIGGDDPGFVLPRRYVVPSGCIAARGCARLGWCGEALTRRACDHTPQEAA